MTNIYNELTEKIKQTEVLGLEFKDNVYYRFDGEINLGTYCSCCYDFYGKLVRLHSDTNSKGEDIYVCPKCKTKVIKGG